MNTQEITEITAEEWDSLHSLLCDDISVKTELSSPLSVSSVDVPELDSTILPSVVVQPVSSTNVVGVPVATSSFSAGGNVPATNGNANNVRVVLNSKVKIRPKPISILTTSKSLPTSHTNGRSSKTGRTSLIVSNPMYSTSFILFPVT